MGIPATTFYALSEQPPELQERIFEKLCDIVTPSKLQIIRNNKIYRSDFKLEAISNPCEKEKLVQAIISIIDSIPNGQVIVYSASVSNCITFGQLLSKHYESQYVEIYYCSMKSIDCDTTLKYEKMARLNSCLQQILLE
ncbi:P-loop containing nucleoside triphosphate hydrolase protein [Gigaspora margarita]|uniref:P-loop containing nucleoside triphosphate hydrolase protein n=1 Tax=Gigaspora margarita TaxID=4874 RepID=A0A8H4ADD2_GIGMA|nr:P-loop containing nucleoside triphosphate hydrolase protein [Gigaspora margarita]